MPISKERLKGLRAKAHRIKPVVMIGSNGLTENVHNEIDLALNSHELIKIKVAGADKSLKSAMLNEIIEKHRAELILSIGHVLTLYRERKK